MSRGERLRLGDARDRLVEHGPNLLEEAEAVPAWRKLLAQFVENAAGRALFTDGTLRADQYSSILFMVGAALTIAGMALHEALRLCPPAAGVARLAKWGLMDDVFATNCPPITKAFFDAGGDSLAVLRVVAAADQRGLRGEGAVGGGEGLRRGAGRAGRRGPARAGARRPPPWALQDAPPLELVAAEPDGPAHFVELRQGLRKPEYLHVHRWTEGDLLLWDDLGTLHNAVPDYGPDELRLMMRCQIMADRVFDPDFVRASLAPLAAA